MKEIKAKQNMIMTYIYIALLLTKPCHVQYLIGTSLGYIFSVVEAIHTGKKLLQAAFSRSGSLKMWYLL